jgi:hypothetical protein
LSSGPDAWQSGRLSRILRVPVCRPREKGQGMLTITPRAARVPMPIPIMFRRTGEEEWLAGRVVNLSESGVLFGPAELKPGATIEVLLSTPVQVGAFATGRQVCAGQVVRATGVGTAAVRFDECRFLLE